MKFENNSFSILAEILNIRLQYENLIINEKVPEKYNDLNTRTAKWVIANNQLSDDLKKVAHYYLYLHSLLLRFKVPETEKEEI